MSAMSKLREITKKAVADGKVQKSEMNVKAFNKRTMSDTDTQVVVKCAKVQQKETLRTGLALGLELDKIQELDNFLNEIIITFKKNPH
jgi:hypothetical protein